MTTTKDSIAFEASTQKSSSFANAVSSIVESFDSKVAPDNSVTG
jgi:hypothetical protein